MKNLLIFLKRRPEKNVNNQHTYQLEKSKIKIFFWRYEMLEQTFSAYKSVQFLWFQLNNVNLPWYIYLAQEWEFLPIFLQVQKMKSKCRDYKICLTFALSQALIRQYLMPVTQICKTWDALGLLAFSLSRAQQGNVPETVGSSPWSWATRRYLFCEYLLG